MSTPKHVHHRVGEWLPKDHRFLESWLDKKIQTVHERDRSPEEFHPVIQEFQQLIETNPELYMVFHQMFEEIPNKPPYNDDPTGKPQVRDYMTMLRLFDLIITEAPSFEDGKFVAVPVAAILDWPMGTAGGLTAFMDPRVNLMLHKMFDVWASFLTSSNSRYVLTTETHGWFGPSATAAIPNFPDTFICDPDAQYHGFKSWDDFFTRRFRDGVRPVQFPDNDSIVNAACESTVYNIASDIKAIDKFWLKGEPYSLNHMLHGDPLAPKFVGGTLFQGFLSALNYHRWHSPVNGKIVKTVMVPGTYYAESPALGFSAPEGPDPSGLNRSQSFLTTVAARALIFIEATNPKIGLMCFMAVGMVEVSTCEITVKHGQSVKKGDQLGMFHFGGSTHCLVFRPETKITFNPDYPIGAKAPLNAAIATVDG
ncbi:hypothetical protein GALMADRAFT_282963 [Galerina marginata CBS 339.88]|uniref:L-tryptophan decarboxylase PsiD-like domain-containing protein n=1 Tax=Galerina marginata (strain CBS 339.88) TaxID=685588 RepID=A0A067SET5_GALM3|nr:hypothetical protein GALMADRAFT_282963 [Galerina marginata CBS 339.88]